MPNSPSPIRIAIADEHSISRNGLRWLLQSDPEMLVVSETASVAGASTILQEQQVDVLLLKFPRNPETALKTLRQLAADGSPVRIVILAETLDGPNVMSGLQLGVSGVILKDSPTEVLFSSIRCVMAGGYWIDRCQVPNIVASRREVQARQRRPKAFGLTVRELEIVKAVVSGSTNKEIGQKFSISENTVKRHLSHIFNKLGASNRVELALFASHHRLLED